jgi:hypothetical protein
MEEVVALGFRDGIMESGKVGTVTAWSRRHRGREWSLRIATKEKEGDVIGMAADGDVVFDGVEDVGAKFFRRIGGVLH